MTTIEFYNSLRNEFIEALLEFSNGKITEKEANIIANQELRVTDFMLGSPLTHKGPRWLAKTLLRSKNIID